ncbi:unnamed protein product [Adineta steineri]|uniref:DUF4590 domain-containing protein n=1 Tax=Adineta steineri TaxID=433720 RepID=A0A813ZCJ1_9BILA|nr:unnamed protein product [Adineta steineri]CAF3485940.1 unnamed protein product [Adineta steineri]
MNRQREYISYSRNKRQRNDIYQENLAKLLNLQQCRCICKDFLSKYDDTSSEDEIIYSNINRLQNNRNSSFRKHRRKFHRNVFDNDLQRNDIYSPETNISQACQVRMIYKKNLSSSIKIDEILIKQKQNPNDPRNIVYKGYLKKGDTFSFKSQRLAQYPFDIKLYINGHIKGHLITCCEYKYHQGDFHINQSFLIENVEKSIPCQKCQRYEKKENEQNFYSSRKRLSNHRSSENRQRLESNERTSTDDEQIEKDDTNHIIQSNNSNNETHDHHENSTRENEMISSLSSMNTIEDTLVQEENQIEQPDINQNNDSSNAENADNSINEFNRMLIERTDNNNNNNGGLFESLFSLFRHSLRQMEVHEPLPDRYEGNVENYVIILFGIKDELNVLNSIVNLIKIFDNIKELNLFLNTLKYEKVILITNDLFIELIQDLASFYSIYIISNNSINNNNNNHLKIRGNFSNLEIICEEIKEECSIENSCLSIEFSSSNQSFCYTQLLKETLLKSDNEGNLKKDFLDFARLHYKNNSNELNSINQYEENSRKETSILWFKKTSFIRKMLNRALSTKEIDILFKIRWFIQSLNSEIEETNDLKIVYRTDYLSENDFEQFQDKNSSNELISFNNYLICNINKPNLFQCKTNMKTILFQIETTMDIPNDGEIFLPFQNIYRIKSIVEINDCWIINLINVNKDDEQLYELTNDLRIQIENPIIIIQLGKLLLLNNDYYHADYFARLLFKDQSLKTNPTLLASLAALHHLLGSMDNKNKNYRAARFQFEESLKIFLSFIPQDNQILSATYNNIGSMFYQDDQHDQAIIYHKKALQCQLKSSSPDIEAIATYSGNIGAVYLDQGKYDQALMNYKRSLQILQQSTNYQESLSIAMIYDRIASIYWKMDKPIEALPFYQKALQLELKHLPENDHKISVSYFNLSTAYAKLDQLDEAIDCAEKSVQQLLKSVPHDHPEVKENTQQLEALKRKKWLLQLYQ